MEKEIVINTIKGIKKGVYVRLHKIKDLSKGVIKHTSMLIRLGLDYDNLKNVEKCEGERKLPWGEWYLYPYVIKHKDTLYLRVYNSHVEKGSVETYYELDNKVISKEEAVMVVGKEEKPTHESECYNVKFDNIVSIG